LVTELIIQEIYGKGEGRHSRWCLCVVCL